MSQKQGTLVMAVLFITLLVITYFAYDYLSQQYQAEPQLQGLSTESTASIGESASAASASLPSAASTEAASASRASTSESPSSEALPSEQEKEEETDYRAPDFRVYDEEGQAVRLSDYIGTPIVLNFWASWCDPCKNEMPDFQKAYERYEREELLFLMVNMTDGSRETEAKALEFIANQGYTFPILLDKDQDAAVTYGVRSIPTTFFIDREGDLAAYYEGMLNEDILNQGIDMIVA